MDDVSDGKKKLRRSDGEYVPVILVEGSQPADAVPGPTGAKRDADRRAGLAAVKRIALEPSRPVPSGATAATDHLAQAPNRPGEPMLDPTKNPDPTNEHAKDATYKKISGDVTAQGKSDGSDISPDDVNQDQLGDCYFLAQLVAEAEVNPTRIRRLIKDNGDGTFTVTLYLLDANGARAKHDVVVDSQFPVKKNGQFGGAHPGKSGPKGPALWPMLLEKAFAKWSGGYAKIGGAETKDDDAFAMMSGEKSRRFSPASVGDSELMPLSGDPVTTIQVATSGPDTLLRQLAQALANKQAVSLFSKDEKNLDVQTKKQGDADHVVFDHGYAVESVDLKARTVSLRNPWGFKHLPNLSIDKVIKYYATCMVAAS